MAANKLILDRLPGKVEERVGVESTHLDVSEILRQISEERHRRQVEALPVIAAKIEAPKA